ncbi:unnamed protein product [Closterium sp. Naga37s-1]|nr:unnamed protein product [Closterium sp. Naga37s-1]
MVAPDPDVVPTLLDATLGVSPEYSPEGSPQDLREVSPDDESGAAAAWGGEREARQSEGAEECVPAAAAPAAAEAAEAPPMTAAPAAAAAAAAPPAAAPAAAEVAAPPMTAAQMDELLDRCLLHALSVSVKPSHLPLGASSLWSNHVLPCRPPSTTVDIKKSSHRKLSKWLHAKVVDGLVKALQGVHHLISQPQPPGPPRILHLSFFLPRPLPTDKRQGGQAPQGVHHLIHQPPPPGPSLAPLPFAPICPPPNLFTLPAQISGREDKHRKEFIVSAVNHRHQALLAFWPHKTSKPAQAPVTAPEGSPGIATGTGAVTATTTVEEVFKPSLHVSPVFEAVGLDPLAFYSPSAVHNAALSYISLHSLTKPSDPSIVILDATLCDALYKGAIKKGAEYPTECPKRDPGPLLLRRMQAQHRVEKGGGVWSGRGR